MESSSRSPEFRALERQAELVRRLASGLLGSGPDADDAVQETWLAALTRPPRSAAEGGNPKGWAARVVGNFARGLHRGRGRREAREQTAARSVEERPTIEVAADLELHRRLVQAVTKLREPYRTAIVLRFFHGLSPAEGARRLELPVETFKTHLKRGLAQLRERLDGLYGDRATWGLALAPFGSLPPAGAAAPLGSGWLQGSTGSATLTTASSGSLGVAMGLKSKLALCTALVAAGFVTWRVVDGPSAGPLPTSPRTPTAAQLAATDPGPVPAPPSLSRAAPAEPRVSVAVEPEPVAWLEPGAAHTSGTVIVVDGDGTEYHHTAGRLVLASLAGGRAAALEVQVQDGSWATPFDESASYVVGSIVLDGREAWLLDPGGASSAAALPLEASGPPLELRATWVGPTRLHVVDLATGAELDDVVLVPLIHSMGFELHPNAEYCDLTQAVNHGRSPIALRGRSGQHEFWLRAEGHAWKRIALDFDAAAESTIALERAGTIEVAVEGRLPELATVRLYRSFAPGIYHAAGERPLREGLATFAGLPEERLTVRFEIGHGYGTPTVLAEAEVDVRLGETQYVTLYSELPDGLHGAAAPFAGSLRVPGFVDRERMSLEHEPLGSPALRESDRGTLRRDQMRPGAEGALLWDLGDVTPGTYRIELQPLQYSWEVEVGPGGARDVRLEVGELASVTLEFVDALSGEPAPLSMLAWMTPREPGDPLDLHSVPAAAPGRYEFHAPPGEFEIWALSDRYQEDLDPLTFGSGANHLRIELERVPGFRLTFRAGDQAVPLPRGFHAVVLESGGTGRGRIRSRDGSSATILVSHPGLYHIGLIPIDGYLPVGTITHEVAPGEVGELVVDLTPLR